MTESDSRKIREMNKRLEAVKKDFRKFLSKKRIKFPRFYLLSDQQMFNLVCSQNSAAAINLYVPYCFSGVSEFIFDDEEKRIIGCKKDKGEEIYFKTQVKI